jgi:D-beta-D-heptose 7-phosphate kinase/D-beta-D-heptose 1-phosphate adenosyltransferase
MKILVVGDSCKDVFIYGKVEKLCPDAPVPVIIPTKRTETGGMAANVYENIESLGIEVDLITNEEVITKTRYIEERTNHQIVRVDSESNPLHRIQHIDKIPFSEYDAVVISDYNKGFLDYEDISYICNLHPCVFIDTKKIINSKFNNAKFIKINEFEYKNNLNAGQLFSDFDKKLVITMGGKGCVYLGTRYPVENVEIKDNCGAGDTFLAAMVVEYCKNKDIDSALKFANQCSTIVVQRRGVNKVGKLINKNL